MNLFWSEIAEARLRTKYHAQPAGRAWKFRGSTLKNIYGFSGLISYLAWKCNHGYVMQKNLHFRWSIEEQSWYFPCHFSKWQVIALFERLGKKVQKKFWPRTFSFLAIDDSQSHKISFCKSKRRKGHCISL